jgi:hypothetical protein
MKAEQHSSLCCKHKGQPTSCPFAFACSALVLKPVATALPNPEMQGLNDYPSLSL